MKVSFLVPDLSWPIVGIAARMARYINGEHEVEIIGPNLWGSPNPMYAEEFAFRPVNCPRIYRFPDFFWEMPKLARAASGEVLIAMKAFASSLLPAVRAARRRPVRVIAYLDEWDGAVSAAWTPRERWQNWRRDWFHPCNNVYVPWVERSLPHCDRRLVTTRFLERKFRGQLFHIGVDVNRFQPPPVEAVQALKEELGLVGRKLIVFGGVARPHKGLETFAEALAQLNRPECLLMILGPLNETVQELMRHPSYGRYIYCPAKDTPTLQRIHREIPLFLGLADVLIVPLTDTLLARSQMPCKVFEAMAMAKPILASAVSDLPEVLQNCGYLVPPGCPKAVAEALQSIFADPATAREMGRRARERCIEHYSAERSRRQLLDILSELGSR